MRVRAVALLVVCLATTLATPALKRYPYGIDVFLGDKVYKLKVRPALKLVLGLRPHPASLPQGQTALNLQRNALVVTRVVTI